MSDTREQILEAARDLFTEQGFEDVSIRDITKKADVNLASVSYHFGGKEGLIQETIKRCSTAVYQYGIDLYEDAIKTYKNIEKIPLKELYKLWLTPFLKPEKCGLTSELMMRLLARYLIQNDYSVPVASQALINKLYGLYIPAFNLHYPKLTPHQIAERIVHFKGGFFYMFSVGQIIMGVISNQTIEMKDIDRDVLMDKAVDFAMYGFGGEVSNP